MKLWRITRRDGSESHVVRAEDAKSARQHLAEQTGRIGRVFTEMADCHRVYLAGPPKVITLVKEVAQ